MRNTVIWSFLSLLALATGGVVSGCDSDAKIAKSSPGESCTKTSDCNDGLKCLNGTCYASSSVIDKSGDGGDGNVDEPPVFVPPTPPNLGKPGESCTKRADCEDGLACLSQRCTDDETVGAGGSGNGPGPALGQRGETCGLTTDCAEGLACLPSDLVVGYSVTTNGTGVCVPTDNGLEPTGSACGGECRTADDCCELPVAVQQPYNATPTVGVQGPWGTGATSCAQLADLLSTADCETSKLAAVQAMCFAQAAYCKCAKNTWTCGDEGRCQYNAACTESGAVLGGCPTYTRLGNTTATDLCNDDSGKCEPVTTPCKTAADCDETVAVSDYPSETCSGDKCACNKADGLCYRACGEDLDCPGGTTCDTKAHLCTVSPECDNDAACVIKYGDTRFTCSEDGKCTPSCDTDLDCNEGGLLNSTNTRICNADHACEKVGCTSDIECAPLGGIRTFCLEASEPSGATVVSAITD